MRRRLNLGARRLNVCIGLTGGIAVIRLNLRLARRIGQLLLLEVLGTLESINLGLCRVLRHNLARPAGTIFENSDVLKVIDMDLRADEVRIRRLCRHWRGRDRGARREYPRSRTLHRNCTDSVNHILWLLTILINQPPYRAGLLLLLLSEYNIPYEIASKKCIHMLFFIIKKILNKY